LTNKQVFISGIGQASAGSLLSQGDYLPRLIAREISANKAYHMAGIKPEDIDLCELHDCFSIASLIAAEGLGLFDHGKSGEAWLNGKAAIGGRVVINPSGGLKAKGHPIGATGIGQVYEIVNQLRGVVDPARQVADAHRGLTDTLGGDGSTICNVILERGW
jgi:acetyl-CoA C-acetyltransferase/acetyl-CoA acyltransferase